MPAIADFGQLIVGVTGVAAVLRRHSLHLFIRILIDIGNRVGLAQAIVMLVMVIAIRKRKRQAAAAGDRHPPSQRNTRPQVPARRID